MEKEKNAVDEYITTFPSGIQTILQRIRSTIREAAPKADKLMSYGIPTYKTAGRPLVYFAAFKKHIGLYVIPTGHAEVPSESSGYKKGKHSVQFPLNHAIPFDLIKRIVEFRVMENNKHHRP